MTASSEGKESLRQEVYLVGKGNPSPDARRHIVPLLAELGIEASFMTAEEHTKYLRDSLPVPEEHIADPSFSRSSFLLDDLTSPLGYLVREHVEDFRTRFRPDLGSRSVGRIFHALIDGANRHNTPHLRVDRDGQPTRAPQPPKGILIRLREEVGLPPYDGNQNTLDNYGKGRACALFAVEVGSLITASSALSEDILPHDQAAIKSMALQLEAQMAAQSS